MSFRTFFHCVLKDCSAYIFRVSHTSVVWLLDLKGEGITFLWRIGCYLPNNKACHPRRLEKLKFSTGALRCLTRHFIDFLKDHKYFPIYSIFSLYVLLILRSTCLYLHHIRLRGKNRVWDKLEFGLHELWRLDICCFQMYQKILLWTTSLIHHAAVHQKETFRRMLKGRSFCFVLKLTFMGEMV